MITSLVGKNSYQILNNKKRIIGDFIKRYGDLSVEQFDAREASEEAIHDALNNLPFLVEKKLVIIDEPSTSKSLTENLTEWLVKDVEGMDVLLIESSPDKRTAWYKFIVQNTNLVLCDHLDEKNFSSWASEYVNSRGGKLDGRVALSLLKRIGPDQQLLANEIDKLLSYNLEITDASVNLLVDAMPQDTVFSLLDSLVAGDAKRTMELYDTLRLSGVDPSEILAMIGWQLHTIALVKSAIGQPATESGLHPFVIQKNTPLAKRLTFKQIEQLVSSALEAELGIKRAGQKSQNAVAVLLFKLLDILK